MTLISTGTPFPKANRLLKRREFRVVMREGKKIVTRQWVFYARSNKTSVSRLGITVSRRVGGAVVRNRLKRRLRVLFRAGGYGIPGFDIVVIGRAWAKGSSFNDSKASFDLGVTKLEELVTLTELRSPKNCTTTQG